jgi:hypothetical protein
MQEIKEKIEVDGSDSMSSALHVTPIKTSPGIQETWWDFRPLFVTKADRYRAYMVILIG